MPSRSVHRGVFGRPDAAVSQRGTRVGQQAVGPAWPSGSPPAATDGLHWQLHDVADLPGIRAELRRHLDQRNRAAGIGQAELRDQLILAFDEMASNALRHGGGAVRALVVAGRWGWLLDLSDEAPDRPPVPAVDRDPAMGGMGLHLVAELSIDYGWEERPGRKHVWARIPSGIEPQDDAGQGRLPEQRSAERRPCD